MDIEFIEFMDTNWQILLAAFVLGIFGVAASVALAVTSKYN